MNVWMICHSHRVPIQATYSLCTHCFRSFSLSCINKSSSFVNSFSRTHSLTHTDTLSPAAKASRYNISLSMETVSVTVRIRNVNINTEYRFQPVALCLLFFFLGCAVIATHTAATVTAAAFAVASLYEDSKHTERMFEAIKINEYTFRTDYEYWSLISDKLHVFGCMHERNT